MKYYRFFVLLVLFGISSCKDDEWAKLVIRLTDSPGDYDAVNIDIQGIEVHTEGGWHKLPNVNTGVYNLLELTNSKETVLTSTEYPTGKISQIRLLLGAENSIVIGETEMPLETPSAQQSGLKLQLHADLTTGITYSILLDFDAARSIVKTGSDKYILKPVIRVISEAQDGAIEGEVTPAELSLAVFAIIGEDTLGTSYVPQGSTAFFIGGLPAGAYKVAFDPGELSDYQPFSLENIEVKLGEVTPTGATEIQLK